MSTETRVWFGQPSHYLNLKIYLLCGLFCWLIIPLGIILVRWLQLKNTSYELTTERLRVRSGVFNRTMEELELYRLKDYRFEQPFWLRIFGKSNILITSSDMTTPRLDLLGVTDGEQVREQIRALVEARHKQQNVREVDYAGVVDHNF
jgi:uncharacterized membrane protein YdbT with pleckstrin-like domain